MHTSHRFPLEEAPDAFQVMLKRQVGRPAGALLSGARSHAGAIANHAALPSSGLAPRLPSLTPAAPALPSYPSPSTHCQVIGKLLFVPQPRPMKLRSML